MRILKRQVREKKTGTVKEKKSKHPERISASACWCQDFRDLERLASSRSCQTGLIHLLHITKFYQISVLETIGREIEHWGFRRLQLRSSGSLL